MKASNETGNETKLAIQWWPTAQLRPYEHNPRRCPQGAIEKVAASLAAFGFRQPIVVDAEGVVVVGHTRLAAAQRLGLGQVPVHVAADLSPAQARAYRLADNRTGEETAWDPELLGCEIAGLLEANYELEVTGFDPAELAGLLDSASLGCADPDAVPAPPVEPISTPGDLWILGEHRLLCGDATRPATCPPDGRPAGHADGHRPALSGRLRWRQPSPDLEQGRTADQLTAKDAPLG